MANTFYVDPDSDILTNLLNFVGNFAVENIFSRFNPFDAAEELLTKGNFDREKMLSFEDITWDTVFAKMKTVEFSNAKSEADKSPHDMAFYMNYADIIHDMDSDALVNQFGEMSVAVSGLVCLEIWESLKEKILSDASDLTNIKTLVNKLKINVAPIIIEVIKKYYSSGEDGIEEELKLLFEQTDEVFSRIEHDETAFFKMIYASLVKGTEVLICNPEYLQLGDRIMSAVKYYTSGVSVTIGEKLSKSIRAEYFDKIEKKLPGVIGYIPTLISMIVTCAIVISVDKNPLMVAVTNEFNKIPTITGNIALLRENAAAFEQMAAKLAEIDLEDLKRTIEGYDHLITKMTSTSEPEELNRILMAYYKDNNKELPWGNRSLEEHWADTNSKLVFK